MLQPSTQASESLDRQSSQLLRSLDALFQRMMMRKPVAEDMQEISREGFRALFLIGMRGALTMSELADALGVPLSTATHTVDRLVAVDLVVRNRSEQDRRVVQVELSEKGKQNHAQFRAAHQQMARSWLAPLTQGEREIFLELMAKIARADQI